MSALSLNDVSRTLTPSQLHSLLPSLSSAVLPPLTSYAVTLTLSLSCPSSPIILRLLDRSVLLSSSHAQTLTLSTPTTLVLCCLTLIGNVDSLIYASKIRYNHISTSQITLETSSAVSEFIGKDEDLSGYQIVTFVKVQNFFHIPYYPSLNDATDRLEALFKSGIEGEREREREREIISTVSFYCSSFTYFTFL